MRFPQSRRELVDEALGMGIDPMQDVTGVGVGIDSLESATDYVNGERVQGMQSSPDLKNITVSVSETMEQESILAGAPL